MYMVVCDVEGCDSVEKHIGHGLGMGPFANQLALPEGWKTVQMMVGPTKEEIEADRQHQGKIKTLYESMRAKMRDADGSDGMQGVDDLLHGGDMQEGVMIPALPPPSRLCRFVMCPKHEVPTMKAESTKPHGFGFPMMPRFYGPPIGTH